MPDSAHNLAASDAHLAPHLWAPAQLADGILAAARGHGLAAGPAPGSLTPPPHDDPHLWVSAAAAHCGLEAEPTALRYADVPALLRHGAPALLRLAARGEPGFLILVGAAAPRLLGPDLRPRRFSTRQIAAALRAPLEERHAATADAALIAAGVPERRRARARAALLREQLADESVGECWILRPPPGAPFARQLHAGGVTRAALRFVGAHTAAYLLWIAAWWLIGQAALTGAPDGGWLAAWGLVLATLMLLRVAASGAQAEVAVGFGAALKARLLAGALALHPDATRRQGVGQLLARVIESESAEMLALRGGFWALLALVELALAAAVLAAGAGGAAHAALLAGWVGLALLAVAWFSRARRRWAAGRLTLTHTLVEQLVGQRTRLAQLPRRSWHAEDDAALAGYLGLAPPMDRRTVVLTTLLPRGWLLAGLAALAPALAGGAPATPVAVALGGVLLAYQSLAQLGLGAGYLANAAIAWDQVRAIFHAAPAAPPASHASPAPAGVPALDASGLAYSYPGRAEAALRACDLMIRPGERVLLAGPSGGGKSTLVALIGGLREPSAGLVLAGGLDRRTLGMEGWRRRVVVAPQFHESHVLGETLAFNLLMGRRWPPHPADLAEAETICRELGLGDLLDRMPAGLHQIVGETGWQLSHGERSRLFIARALLQGAELIVLDESFAALDPETLDAALTCVLRRAPALIVVAHP